MSRRVRALLIGGAVIAVSVLTFVLVPLAVAVVAAAWLMVDADLDDRRAPGWLGKVGLILLAVAWAATAWLVLTFDSHFSCGGTLGGFGESASARLDEQCFDRVWIRVPIAVAIVSVSSAAIGVLQRRRALRTPADDEPDGRSSGPFAAGLVGGCVLGWSALLTLAVVI